MSMIRYAQMKVLASQMGDIPSLPGDSLRKTAHRWDPTYDPKPGMLYVRSRAISSRTNDNYDTFPAEEIASAWRTFIGKPVFVNHHNANHRRARGVMIDAILHEDLAPDGSPDTWVEVLMEVDAARFPKLAEAIVKGHIDRTSMGVAVARSTCSFCGNTAEDPSEFCRHIPAMKGQRISRRNPETNAMESVLVHEICAGLHFFENSLLMEDPADPTAVTTGLDTSGLAHDPTTARLVTASRARPRKTAGLGTNLAGEGVVLNEAARERAWIRYVVKNNTPSFPEDTIPRGRHAHVGGGVFLYRCHVCNDYVKAWGSYVPQIMDEHEAAHGLDVPGFNAPLLAARTASDAVSKPEDMDLDGVTLAQDDKGYYVRTHRSRSDSYADPHDIPRSVIDQIESTGSLSATKTAARSVTGSEGYLLVGWEEGGSPVHACEWESWDEAAELVPLCGADPVPFGPGEIDPEDVDCPTCRSLVRSGVTRAPVSSRLAVNFHREALGEQRIHASTQHTAWPNRKNRLDDMEYRYDPGEVNSLYTKQPGVGVYLNGEQVGYLLWDRHNNRVNNISVRPKWRGKGIKDLLIEKAKSINNLLVVPDFQYAAGRYTAVGEQRAPAKVDTLRDESCPVCGTVDYRGDACNNCGYIKPPVMFHDPDTEAAQVEDMRTESAPVDLACDSCGAVYPAQQAGSHQASHNVTAAPVPKGHEIPVQEDEDGVPDPPPLPAEDSPEESEVEQDGTDGEDTSEGTPEDTPVEDEDQGDADADESEGGDVSEDEGDDTDAAAVSEQQQEQPTEQEALPEERPTRVPQHGDLCPSCGNGTLLPKEEVDGVEPDGTENSAATDAAGQAEAEDDAEAHVEDEGVDMTDQPNRQARRQQARNSAQAQRLSLHQALRGQQGIQREQAQTIERQGKQIVALREALTEIVKANPSLARRKAVASMMPKTALAALRRQADTTEKKEDTGLESDQAAAEPIATDDVESIGAAPDAANEGVTPDATTDVTEQTVALPQAPLNDLEDVTDLSDASAPSGELVPSHTPNLEDPDTRTSDEDVQWDKTSSNTRLMASLRLARLRKAAGLTESGADELLEGQKIASSKDSTEKIETEIETLEKVVRVASRNQHPASAPRHLVPRQAQTSNPGGVRTAPSFQAQANRSGGDDDVLLKDSIY